jgi:hypothetical protein
MILSAVLAAALAIPIAVVQSSFAEWAFHRYWLHRPWLPKDCFTSHTLIHHQLCKYADTFLIVEPEQEEASRFNWWGGPVLTVITTAPWALLGLGLWLAGLRWPFLPFVVGFGLTVGLYYVGYEGTHYLMHKPAIGWIERSRWFRFIEKHHRIHHVQMDRNLNVLLPLADLVLGTLVLDAVVPAVTPEGARRLARRHSKRGRTWEVADAPASAPVAAPRRGAGE